MFNEARETVIRSNAYGDAWHNVSAESLGEYSNVIARAIAAQAMLICEQQEKYPPILTNAKLRDQLVDLLSLAFAEAELGLGDWALGQIARLALPIGTNYVVGKRGAVTNKISPMPCDILLYQARGGKIRDFIRETIEKAEPPVVLLAHSLGGIACVDLLVQQPLPQVVHLVTVGSQAPFLYEINALCSLEFAQPLPEHFPEWLNLYDLRDFLSYKGSQIFPKVRDEEVNSLLPFPRSHSAYWEQDKTWEYCRLYTYWDIPNSGSCPKAKGSNMLADILAQLQQKQASEGESGVTVAFELNWESLEPQAQKLACLLSIFALAPIPWSLVQSAASACNLEFDIKASCTILIQRYLLQEKAQDTYQIHERIRELLRLKLEDLAEVETHHDASQLKRGFCQALVAVAQDVSQTPTQIQIAKASLAIPHFAEAATTYQDWLDDEDLIWVFLGLGRFYEGQGAYEQALPWFTQSLSATRKRFGEEHPDVAISLNNLALLYKSLGRYSEAEPLYIDALEMTKRLLGEEHPDVAISLDNLALLYKSLGRYSEAEPLHIKALEMKKRLLGEEHPDVAISLDNLALLYKSLGRYSEAEPLHIKALEMKKRLLGEEHSDVATSLNNLASLYDSLGRYSEAEPLHIQALEMKKRLLGEQHPDVATSLNNLALLYKSLGRYSEAEPLYIQALEMRKRLLGEQHPDVATSLNNLALLYKSLGRYSEAEPLYIQALEIAEKVLGVNHPHTLTYRENLEDLRKKL